MGGYGGKEVVGYANLEELQALLDPFSYRVLKVDCLDLPEKIYQRLTVGMSPEQARLYKQIKDEMLATFAGHEIEVINVLAQMLRLAQVTGGFIPIPADEERGTPSRMEPIPGPNPKLVALLETIENITGKAIIWCRFRAEIDIIQKALRQVYGNRSVVEFHGGVNTTDRGTARREFQDPSSPVRFFVGQIQTGGIGLTLTQAKTVFYFSNSFSLEDRLQSEDRAHRIGQDAHVTYIDLVARGTIDVKVLGALRAKKNLANLITGDTWTQWL
jgi:SNF2 family DNA or RNA helicase